MKFIESPVALQTLRLTECKYPQLYFPEFLLSLHPLWAKFILLEQDSCRSPRHHIPHSIPKEGLSPRRMRRSSQRNILHLLLAWIGTHAKS